MALWAGTIAALLSAALVLAIFVLRGLLLRQHRRRQRLLAVWRPQLSASLAVDSVHPLPRLRSGEIAGLLLLWNHFQGSLRGEAKERLNALARTLGIPAIAQRALAARGLRRRLLAAVTLGQLGERGAWEDLRRTALAAHPLLSLTAARALVQIDASTAVPLLMPSFANRLDWPLARVATLLREADPGIIAAPLVGALDGAAAEAAVRVVSLFDLVRAEAVTPALQRLLERPDTDDRVLTTCLRVLRDPRLLELVRALTAHGRWHIRMEAAKALGRLGTVDDLARLEGLLSDAQWWVRYRAAQAIARLPFVTRADLEAMRDRQADRYARDILVQVLAEKALA